jgi:hypothetical protein
MPSLGGPRQFLQANAIRRSQNLDKHLIDINIFERPPAARHLLPLSG